MHYVYCIASLGDPEPEIGRGVPNACVSVKYKQTKSFDILHVIVFLCKNGGE